MVLKFMHTSTVSPIPSLEQPALSELQCLQAGGWRSMHRADCLSFLLAILLTDHSTSLLDGFLSEKHFPP